MAGTASDGELNTSTPPIATTETTDPSGGAITPSLDGAGHTTLQPTHDNIIDKATTDSTPSDCPTGPTSTVPDPTTTPSDGAATADPEPTVAPPGTTLEETPISSDQGATGEEPSLVLEQTAEISAATGEDPTLVPEPTAEITTPPSGVTAENAASLLPSHPTPPAKIRNADPVGVVRRPRSKRGRPQEALTFGAKKQEAIHNQNQAPPPPPPEATVTSSPPREGGTDTVQEESTPLPPRKRVKKGKNKGSSSSSAQMSSPPPPSPPEAAKSDSQVLKNRKDKDGNVKWYFSSGGPSSLRKCQQHILHPPPQNPPVYGPQLPFPCSICGRGFYTIRSLCGHMKAHPGRAWRGAFPPPENMIPTLAPPVLGEDAGDNGTDGTDGKANAETEEVGGQIGQSMPELNGDNNEGVGHDEEPAATEVQEERNEGDEEPAAATAELHEDTNEGVEDEEPAAVTADQLHKDNEGAVHEQQPAVAELHEEDKGVVHEEPAAATADQLQEDNEGAVHEEQPAAVVEMHVVNADAVVHEEEELAAAVAEAVNVVVQEVIRGSDGKIIPDLNGPPPTDSDEDRSNG